MDMLVALISLLVLALLLPLLHRIFGDRFGYAVALLPLGIAVHFGRQVGAFQADESVSASYKWVPGLDLSLSLHLDGLSLFFVLLIAAIGAVISVYAAGYLAGHRQFGQFFSFILLFMAAMLGVVLAGNILTLYVFWELTTLTSFLLIGFDHEREAARAAAAQSLLTTAAGGLALLAGLILLGTAGGSYEIAELLQRGDAVRNHPHYPAIVALVLLGAFTKSAQFPFHFWLPNAMQAPTPVSAYLHSATMVKAGIYLLARFTPVLAGTDLWTATLTWVGAATMLLGAWLAFYQHDLKAILAYLTINALGTLTMLLGVGTPLAIKAALTYLLAHALYKGALFLMAGAVDHATHTRDIRELGGLWRRMPFTAIVALLAALSMAGVLPLFGFVAKELFFEAVWHAPAASGVLAGISVLSGVLLVAGAGLVGVSPFFGRATGKAEQGHKLGPALWLGPALLAAGGLAVGLFPQPLAAPLLQPAAAATLGGPLELKLALWHGVAAPLVLGLSVLAGGIVLYVARDPLRRWVPLPLLALKWGPASWYDRGLAAVNRLAQWQSGKLQSGYLRIYVLTTVGTMVALVAVATARLHLETPGGLAGALFGAALPNLSWLGRETDHNSVRFHEAIAAGLVLAAALVAVRSDSRLKAVASLGVVGFGVAWIYSMFGAPDLAMTQIVVESLTVILFVLSFRHLPRFKIVSSRRARLRDATVAIAAGGLMTTLLLVVIRVQHHPVISRFHAENSVPLAHGRNIVNTILVDFRALDTLGEITVLATAGMGVYALLQLNLKGPSS